MNKAIVSVGSNINAEQSISTMLQLLKTKVKVLDVSSFIKTKPIGITDQADFTNGAVRIQTEYDTKELNLFLKSIEDQMGRDRSAPKFGPRVIDLDILVWNGQIVDDDYHSREFLQKSVEELGGL